MTTYTIKKGAVNAKPNKTALRFVRDGAAWRVRFKLDRDASVLKISGPAGSEVYEQVLETRPVPNTHIKLLGLTWSGWMVWQRMREAWKKEALTVVLTEEGAFPTSFTRRLKAALRQYLAWTHGNSARVIAKWETRKVKGKDALDKMEWEFGQRGVSLSTYYYLNGRGAVTTGSPVAGKEIAWLPEDPKAPGWTVWGEVEIWVVDKPSLKPAVLVRSTGITTPIPLSRRPWCFGLCKPHARNGGKGSGREHAPCDLTFEMERI